MTEALTVNESMKKLDLEESSSSDSSFEAPSNDDPRREIFDSSSSADPTFSDFLRKRNRRSYSWHTSPAAGLDDTDEHPPPPAADHPPAGGLHWPNRSNIVRSFSHELPSEIVQVASRVAVQAEELVLHIWKQGWKVVSHHSLPHWLKDNDFLVFGHRPQLNSFRACFKSIFRIHTETVNIWTHLIGFVAFLAIALYFLSRPSLEVQWQEKAVFSAFFAGAILCLGFSWLFHTVYCHSERVGRLFNKLDYCGIALLTIGSFVPWLYYSFYCQFSPKIIYLLLILTLGILCIVVSLMDQFSAPKYRALRAGVFVGLGLSGVIPSFHYLLQEGVYRAVTYCAFGWLVLMAVLYITGAVIYALRIPECLFPGKFDIWFQSHQIFHVFVVAAAFVHFYGISVIAKYRLEMGPCDQITNYD